MSRPALLPVALLVVVLAAGCLGGGNDPAVREDEAVETLSAARDAAAAVESYRLRLTLSASSPERAEAVELHSDGKVNVTTRKMAMTSHVRGETLHGYVDGRTAYEQCPPSGLHWGSENVTAENWTAATPLGRQVALLSTGDLFYNGTETLDGTEVVHLSGRPSLSALGERTDVGATSLPDPDRIDRLEIDAWFDADTHRLVRSRLLLAVSADGQTATADLTLRVRDYGAPVSITVPTEARGAFFEGGCPN
jgi:hypothetical protein